MGEVELGYGGRRLSLDLPADLDLRVVEAPALPPASDPLGLVAAALDEPVGAAPLGDLARGASPVTIVVPDATRPSATPTCVLPALARLAQAGSSPRDIRLVVARGIHTAAPKPEIARLVGEEVLAALSVVQSAPDAPELNVSILEDEDLGDVRVHRLVAEAGLVLLVGTVVPHHVAGYGGGAKALVPGTAERETVLAAHRLSLRALVRPDGEVRSAAGAGRSNAFRHALLRVARRFGRCFLLNTVLADDGSVAAAWAGDVERAHAAAIEGYERLRGLPAPEPRDLVIVGASGARGRDLIQAHKALLVADAWARPGAPVVWLAEAPEGAGHATLLPWFEIRRLERHLAALRQDFHPYGLTAYSIRHLAKRRPVYVVSRVDPDILRPMGLLPCADAETALRLALAGRDVRTVAVLPSA